ncbi:MAG: NADH-quinone oxidoreductase subunit C [Bacteroidetes bacterium]|nr:NADH-quinone oxidoreductase subunit C [Bacteroidota bacterium]
MDDVPIQRYEHFYNEVLDLLSNAQNHCLTYYAYPINDGLKFICAIGNDEEQMIYLKSFVIPKEQESLTSLTENCFQMHIFEREIWENWGIHFNGHPFLKPVRYAFNRKDKEQIINNYPFYKIESDELHEVGVGPIHAGVIEPGHFRFQCNGEMVLHLEIQLGWQHRGIEALFLEKKKLIQRNILAESITGDTVIGHNLAFCQLMEGLGGITVTKQLEAERVIALELERIAMHVGDLSAMCTDVAYQLGSAVFGALRTPLINFTQAWCGNRFGKGMVRIGGTYYPISNELILKLTDLLNDFEWRFNEIADRTFNLPSVVKRFESIGTVTKKQVELFGGVGMVAKMSGIKRDTRFSHPFAAYKNYNLDPVVQETGDVNARGMVRRLEIEQSISVIRSLLIDHNQQSENVKPSVESELKLSPNSLVLSLTEGWRGEICHVGVTDDQGQLVHYKIKALELSLRDLEISDFPINNKSYDLSYCGHDL